MAEVKKGTEIKKWDEVNGAASGEILEDFLGSESDGYALLQMNDSVGFKELPGFESGRNPLRGIEDMVEQNDNQLDGVINNVPVETVAEKEAKSSVIEKLKVTIPDKHCKGIYIKVSPKEMQAIRERMESVGIQNLSAYMLKMAMNGFIIQLDMSDMKEVLRLMKIDSNNLNQYAKKANETGSIYKEDIKELMVIHKELLQMLGEILERLGNIE